MSQTTSSRDYSIDILKCFAALVITWSHFDKPLGDFSYLATGGSFGDCLFFFCSGYTLFLGREASFFNWYKRRINRIYPTVLSWALLSSALGLYNNDMIHTIISGGGWFVSCIMIYYIILWFVRRFAISHLNLVIVISAIVILIWYYTIGLEDKALNSIYGATYFRWCHFFLPMLLGAKMGFRKKFQPEFINKNALRSLGYLLFNILAFYAILYFNKKIQIFDIQLLSLIPLLMVAYNCFMICNSPKIQAFFSSKGLKQVVCLIGGLCLEIYLVQQSILTDALNWLFPINLFLIFITILLSAYILKCMSKLWIQTFSEKDYDLKQIFKVY